MKPNLMLVWWMMMLVKVDAITNQSVDLDLHHFSTKNIYENLTLTSGANHNNVKVQGSN